MGPNDTCYRLSGDEFCVLADVPGGQVDAFLTRTTTALGGTGEGFDISTAFGCAFLPDDAAGPAEALAPEQPQRLR